jgi:hypothetical protein
MLDVKFTLVKRKASPVVQVVIALAIGWTGMLACKIFQLENSRAYFAAFVGIIFFCLINTVVSIAYNSFLRYTVISYYIYIGLVVVLLLSAKLFSGISIWKLESYRNMLVSISIFYLIASLMVRGIRYIYEIAESDR